MVKPIQFDGVADIYDCYVTASYDIPFFLKETENINDDILELMCGTGRVSIPLLEAKRRLICIDYSQGMLDSFRKKIEGKHYPVELITMDVTKLKLDKKFGMIILPFHSFSEILEPDLQLTALKAISSHLEKNGIFICTLQNSVVKLKTADGVTKLLGSFPSGNGNKLIVSYMNQIAPDRKTITGFQLYEIFNSMDILIGKRYLEINFRPVLRREFEEMATQANLEIVNVYGDYSHSDFDEARSTYMIYRLRRK